MGVYDNITLTGNDIVQKTISMAAYINNIDGITAEAFDDDSYTGFTFSFDGTNVNGEYKVQKISSKGVDYWLKNGDIYLINPESTSAGGGDFSSSIIMHSYASDELKIISFRDQQQWRYGMELALLNVGNTKLIGYKALTASPYGVQSFIDVSDLYYKDCNDGLNIPYSYTNMFPYAAPAGTLDFLNQAYFVNGSNVKKFTTEFLKECSAVNLLSSASLPAPLGNYLAIGAHCLAPLDEEGGDE